MRICVIVIGLLSQTGFSQTKFEKFFEQHAKNLIGCYYASPATFPKRFTNPAVCKGRKLYLMEKPKSVGVVRIMNLTFDPLVRGAEDEQEYYGTYQGDVMFPVINSKYSHCFLGFIVHQTTHNVGRDIDDGDYAIDITKKIACY